MINVIGLGYIGLPTALMFAKSGNEVVGTDFNGELVDSLNRGRLTFEEKGLDELFVEARTNGITFSTEYQKSDVYLIAVPTPFIRETKKIDPQYLVAAMNSILDVCAKDAVVIIESTIAPGTIDRFIRPEIIRRGLVTGEDIHLVHAPERIIPGNMVYELEHNSRTIGADEPAIAERVKELYATFCRGEIVLTDVKSAEMSKVVENTFRDINIAFANVLAKICREDAMDVYEVIRIANKHPRVNILQPGPGVGGHCIPIDPWFLVGEYPSETGLVHTARMTNDSMPAYVIKRIREIMLENGVKDVSRVGIYGLSYKEDVDDTRESPGLQLMRTLDEHLATGVRYYDPHVAKTIVPDQYFDFDRFLQDIDILVILTAHTHIRKHMDRIKGKIIFDTKNVCPHEGVYQL